LDLRESGLGNAKTPIRHARELAGRAGSRKENPYRSDPTTTTPLLLQTCRFVCSLLVIVSKRETCAFNRERD